MVKYLITSDAPAKVALLTTKGEVSSSADLDVGHPVVLTVRDSRGTFSFEDWQKMPPEIPPPLKPWWRD